MKIADRIIYIQIEHLYSDTTRETRTIGMYTVYEAVDIIKKLFHKEFDITKLYNIKKRTSFHADFVAESHKDNKAVDDHFIISKQKWNAIERRYEFV